MEQNHRNITECFEEVARCPLALDGHCSEGVVLPCHFSISHYVPSYGQWLPEQSESSQRWSSFLATCCIPSCLLTGLGRDLDQQGGSPKMRLSHSGVQMPAMSPNVGYLTKCRNGIENLELWGHDIVDPRNTIPSSSAELL